MGSTCTNLLVDARGHVIRVAGLGVVFPLSAIGVGIDRFFHSAAQELVDPLPPSTDADTTQSSDMYASGVLVGTILNEADFFRSCSLGKFRSPRRVGLLEFILC